MTDDRNLSTHTYDEKAVEEIYQQVGDYWKLMDEFSRRLAKKIG
jgi:hypothetical protein